MTSYIDVNKLLTATTICDSSRIVNESFLMSGVTPLKIRDSLYRMGRIVNDASDKNAYVAIVKAGFLKMDAVSVAVQVAEETVIVAAYMRRSLCSKRICKGAINELKRELER
ncbi:MAG: hypothetical protein IJM57_07800 [Lachnospiraceae bacterium]|nr:hypothetical protein [Lachnospiraceae bacterium]